MTSPIHLIAEAKQGFNLSNIVKDFKKFTANQLLDPSHEMAPLLLE